MNLTKLFEKSTPKITPKLRPAPKWTPSDLNWPQNFENFINSNLESENEFAADPNLLRSSRIDRIGRILPAQEDPARGRDLLASAKKRLLDENERTSARRRPRQFLETHQNCRESQTCGAERFWRITVKNARRDSSNREQRIRDEKRNDLAY